MKKEIAKVILNYLSNVKGVNVNVDFSNEIPMIKIKGVLNTHEMDPSLFGFINGQIEPSYSYNNFKVGSFTYNGYDNAVRAVIYKAIHGVYGIRITFHVTEFKINNTINIDMYNVMVAGFKIDFDENKGEILRK